MREPQTFYGANCIADFFSWIQKDLYDFKYFNGKRNEKNRSNFIFVGHNAGKYDMVLMLPYAMAFFPLMVVGLPTNVKEVQFGNIKFIDSCMTLKGSLRNLAVTFKVENMKGDLDFKKMNKDNFWEHRDEVVKYCTNDCLVLSQIWRKFQDELTFMGFNTKKIPNPISAPSPTLDIFQCCGNWYHKKTRFQET